MPFANGKPIGEPVDVLTGFLSPEGKAYGRPVGVAIDARGALLVVDDVEMNRELVGLMLLPYGYEITEAVDGAEAVKEAVTPDPK